MTEFCVDYSVLLKQKSLSSDMNNWSIISNSLLLWYFLFDQYVLFFCECGFLWLIILINDWWNVCLNTWLDCWKQSSWQHGSFLTMWMCEQLSLWQKQEMISFCWSVAEVCYWFSSKESFLKSFLKFFFKYVFPGLWTVFLNFLT